MQFQTIQPVRIQGAIVVGQFEADYSELIESLVDNGLIEPVFAPEEPREIPCWDLDHCEA